MIALINDLFVTSFDETRLVYLGDVKKCSFNMWQAVFKPNSFKWYIKMKIFGFFATFLSLAQVCPQHSSKTKIDFVGNRGPGFPDHRTRSKSNWSGIQSANRSNFGPVVRALD